MKKLIVSIIFAFFLSGNAFASSDGKLELSNNGNGEVKDCFEGLNRGIFAFNQALDLSLIHI